MHIPSKKTHHNFPKLHHKPLKHLKKSKMHKQSLLSIPQRFSGCGCGSDSVCGTASPLTQPDIDEEQSKQTKTVEKMRKQQRDFSLRLYRSILRAHRFLPPEMRLIGDVYVKEEFHLHKNAQPQHLQPFFEQWIGYLHHLREAFGETGDVADASNLGQNIPHEDLDALDDEKREKLFKMHDETARLFGGQIFASDLGLEAVPEDLKGSGIFGEDAKTVDAI